MKLTIFRILTLSALLGSPAAFCNVSAQESTAGGTLGAQASWTALQNMLTATNGNVSLLRIDVNEIKACANQGKIWKQGTGCVIPTFDTSDITKIISCGKLGMVYGPGTSGANANGCKAPTSNNTTPALYWTGYATEVTCPTGYKVINCQANYQTYGGTIDSTKMMEPIYTSNGCRGRTDSAEFGRDNPQTRSFTASVRALCIK